MISNGFPADFTYHFTLNKHLRRVVGLFNPLPRFSPSAAVFRPLPPLFLRRAALSSRRAALSSRRAALSSRRAALFPQSTATCPHVASELQHLIEVKHLSVEQCPGMVACVCCFQMSMCHASCSRCVFYVQPLFTQRVGKPVFRTLQEHMCE